MAWTAEQAAVEVYEEMDLTGPTERVINRLQAALQDAYDQGVQDHAAERKRLLQQTLTESQDAREVLLAWRETAYDLIAALTPRQHQIMDLVLTGQANKNIAADLKISQRTVENHRALIMKRTSSNSLPALARLALAAALYGADEEQ